MNPGGPALRLAALAAKVRAQAEARLRDDPRARVRLARPLPSAVAPAPRAPAGDASAAAGGPEPMAPYAQDLESFRVQISGCLRCPAGTRRRRMVFGEGPVGAPIAFVVPGPGYDEELAGNPVAGAAGELFDRMLAAMGMGRSGVHVCPLWKCRCHDPAGEATAQGACAPYLAHQLALAAPRAVVALGEPPARALLGSAESLDTLRGRWGAFQGLRVMPTYHPRDLLRDEGLKRHVWEDLKKVLKAVGAA